MAQAANSALHSARLRFVEGLPARAEELSNVADRLARDPGDLEAAGILRRRLHALLASAQVFEERALSLAVQDLIARLDVAQRAERPFTSEEIDAVSVVVASLPTYVRPTLQPTAAYSDVRELLTEARARFAAEEYVPAALSDSQPRPAPSIEGESARSDLAPKAAHERVDPGTPAVRQMGRRIIALSALQPGASESSQRAESDAASSSAPISEPISELNVAIDTSFALGAAVSPAVERAGIGPLPEPEARPDVPPARELRRVVDVVGAVDAVEVVDVVEDVEPDADDVITQTLTLPSPADLTDASDDGWSHAVENAGEALVAWRESLRPEAMPEIEIEDEAARPEAPDPAPPVAGPEPEIDVEDESPDRGRADDAITLDTRPEEPITLDVRPSLEAAAESGNAAASAAAAPAPALGLREPNVTESGVYASTLSPRAAAVLGGTASSDFADEPDSSVIPVLPLVALTPAADPPSAEADDQDLDVVVDLDPSEQTSPGLGPPVLLRQTVSGLLPAPRPALVLLVADAACAARAKDSLPDSAFELVTVASADEAVRQLHDAQPDVVLVSAEFASSPEADLVRRLKLDPLSPVPRVHLLLAQGASCDDTFLRQIGADGAISEPLTAAVLTPLAVAPDQPASADPSGVREGTIDDIANQIAEEIRRGIAESLRAGKNERVSVGDGTELMAAAWSAIGRVRSHLAEQNRGRVRFKDEERRTNSLLPPVASIPPSATSADASDDGAASPHPSQLLAGCRVLVADDDPAVLWFFVGLLREASAQVLQAHNGREALELARRKQPHVIVSDILMPKLDGFGLCRELKRDALLAHVPVILLSWKDDLLQRMRELDAGAAGYLRKEAGSQQILAHLVQVLQPRTRLIAKLRGHVDVNGSLEELGVLAVLELVAAERPDARITLRDAYNLFEVDIRGGRKVSVSRTAADGAFTRGEKALMQLLGIGDGQFEVSYSTTPQRATITEPLDRALVSAGRRLAALLDAVSDARLLRVCLIAFDDDVLASLLAAPSTRLREVVELFRTGNATAESVLREGRFAPGELEDYLRELARSVAITGVWDSSGEDLVVAAQRDRETPQLALLGSSFPPRAASHSLSEALYSSPSLTPSTRPTPMVPPPLSLEELGVSVKPRAREPETELRVTSGSPDPATELMIAQSPRAEADTVPEPLPPAAAVDDRVNTEPGVGPVGSKAPAAEKPLLWATPALDAVPENAAALDEQESDAVSQAELQSFDLPTPSMYARAQADRTDTVRLSATLIVLVAVGYFGWQQFARGPRPAVPETATSQQAAASPEVAAAAPAQAPEQPAIRNTQFGKVLPFVDTTRGVEVPPDQGLLVVEFQGEDPAPTVRVGARELGKPPLALALPPGRHELVVRSGKSTSFRYLIVRAGETRIVSLPLAEL